ncbi:MAG: hypothetical protein NUV37_03180 [Nanoarchaeota archaeon]|nr:hypothetical protein [Nanoarchaeota archaeon]
MKDSIIFMERERILGVERKEIVKIDKERAEVLIYCLARDADWKLQI